MTDEFLTSSVTSTTTHVHGRTLNSARMHNFIIDGPVKPNEEIVSMEAFLAGVASCATHLMEDFAEEDGIRLERVATHIKAFRPKGEPNRFDHIDLRIEFTGPTQAQAEHLVGRFKDR
ncbi:MAG: OsmC family protein [Chloroflexota bacterium]